MARSERREARGVRAVVWGVGLLPALLIGVRVRRDGLGANPIEALIETTGHWALILLLITLLVTPLRRLTGRNAWIKARRPLGLFAFFWATLHWLTYLGLDQTFDWGFILEDVAKRPYITVGTAAFLLLLPLAVTSTKGWIRRLGRRWSVLHRLIYVAVPLVVVHYWWQVKADTRWPLVAAAVYLALMGARLWLRRRAAARSPAPRARDGASLAASS